MKTLNFTGTVRTSRVGSDVNFEFEIYEDDLPSDPNERRRFIDKAGLDALFESGAVDWSYEESK